MSTDAIQAQLDRHEDRIRTLEFQHELDKIAMDEIKKDTGEIVALLRDAQGAWRVFEMIGKAAKPFMWVAIAIGAIGAVWGQMKGMLPWSGR